MELFDIHTHTMPVGTSQGVVNVRYPEAFAPVAGVWYSVGVHPWDVSLGESVDWETFRACAAHPQVVALGECGLDRCVQAGQWNHQLSLFLRQAELAEAVRKPLFIHNVRATEVLLALRKRGNYAQPWMLHGFRGQPETAGQAVRQGFYLSFGSRYNEASLRSVPLDRLLLETDDAPTPLLTVYQQAAAVRNIPVEQLAAQVRQNVRALLGI